MYEIITMNGYGIYVWSSFLFTFACFLGVYLLIQLQLKKEQNKFKTRYLELNQKEIKIVKSQETYKEILAFSNISNISKI